MKKLLAALALLAATLAPAHAGDLHATVEGPAKDGVTYTVRAGCLDVSATLANRARHALHLSLSWEVGGDFADIQEAEASHPEDHGLFYRTRIEPEDALDMEFDLSPQEIRELAFRVWPSGTPADLTVEDMEARRVERERWRDSFTRIEMPGDRLAEQILANNIPTRLSVVQLPTSLR